MPMLRNSENRRPVWRASRGTIRHWPFWILAGLLSTAVVVPTLRSSDPDATAGPDVPGRAAPPGVPAPMASPAPLAPAVSAAPEDPRVPGDPLVGPGVTEPTPVPSDAAVDDGEIPPGWTRTRFGPLSPADRDFLVRVRLAGLWEAPAGLMAGDHSADSYIRQVGARLASDHTKLDAEVRSIATQLALDLPNRPTDQQQGWVDELSRKRGADFDTTFVARLRAAHGSVFTVIAAVRSGTRNNLVRSFAQTAIIVVMRHITLLENTDLVDFSTLPPPPDPPANAPMFLRSTRSQAMAVWVILVAVLGAGAWFALRRLRSR